MSVKIVETKDLTVRYQGIEALSAVSFAVSSGDYVGIVGPNGSGKTTLIKSFFGLIPMEGTINLFAQSRAVFNDWRRIGYLPQKGLFLDSRFPATAGEVVASGLLLRKAYPRYLNAKDRHAIKETMTTLGIVELKDRPIGKLSGGQQQRVLLARALAHDPDLLILDEPTVALDPTSRETFYGVLEHLNKAHGTTILLVSHDVSTISRYANKLLYLDRKVEFYGACDAFAASEAMARALARAAAACSCHRDDV